LPRFFCFSTPTQAAKMRESEHMAEQDVTSTVSAEGTQATEPATTSAAVTGDATGTNSGATERTFTQADLDRIVTERLEREREKAKKEAAKAQADAEAKVLAEQGKYKELFEKQQADLQAAQAAARDKELQLLRRDAAAQANLPAALAERLKGETLEDMLADAKSILAALPKPAAPNVNASSGDGAAPRGAARSEDEKQRLADRFGVKPGLVQ
jgi:ribosomal protein L12E/L44/L45/RPP1/RPP2